MTTPIHPRRTRPTPVQWEVTVRRYFELKDQALNGALTGDAIPPKLVELYIAAEQELRKLGGCR